MTPSPPLTPVHAYRALLRASLHAVHYSKPARYTALNRLRHAFRAHDVSKFDGAKIARTLEFLEGAASVRGLEHKILKNLMHVLHERSKLPRTPISKENLPFRQMAYDQFDATVAKLNESMGMCI